MSNDTKPSPEAKPLKGFEDAYTEYTKELGSIWEGTSQNIANAQQAYLDRCKGAKDAKDIEAVQQDYLKAVRAAWDASQQGYSRAYAKFLESHKSAWSHVDPRTLSPWAAASISASASSAAAYANATIDNWSLIAHAGVPPVVLGMLRAG